MNSDDQFLSKSSIDYRFRLAITVLLDAYIAKTKAEIANEMGVKSAKFSEILNGRMHAGVDMLAVLSQCYLVDPDWLLTGRGENMFRKTSILPPRLQEGEVNEAHPYTFEDEKKILNQMIDDTEKREKEIAEKHAAPLLLNLMAEKDKLLLSQAEEIGRLKARIEELERELSPQTSTPRHAHSPTPEPVET